MADFSIEFEKGSDIEEYFSSIVKKIDINAFFSAKLFIDDNLAFFHIKPLIFPMYWISPIIWIFSWVLMGTFNLTVFLIGGIPAISFLFYTKQWYIIVLYIGKWKGKYKGKIKPL